MTEPVKKIPHVKRLNLLVTKYCNLHCRMCDYKHFSPFYDQELSLDQLKSVIQEMAALGGEVLELSGGEPMVRKGIYEIISYGRSLNLKVFMATNGVLIGPSEAEKLLESGLISASFSLEGPEQLNDELRGPGNFQKTLNAIRNFLSHQATIPNLEVNVGITLSKYNYQSIVSFSKFLLEEIGVHQITINPFEKDMLVGKNYLSRPVEFHITPELIPDLTGKLQELTEYAESMPGKLPAPNYLNKIPDYFLGQKFIPKNGCQIPLSFCGIAATGGVYPCWKTPPVGNLKKMSLTEILSSEKAQKLRERALAGQCNGCLTSCYREIY
jgi:MoaA/NifB/PqqE/SkfB family radical SAM enzyme